MKQLDHKAAHGVFLAAPEALPGIDFKRFLNPVGSPSGDGDVEATMRLRNLT
jgi:hypothetical protein